MELKSIILLLGSIESIVYRSQIKARNPVCGNYLEKNTSCVLKDRKLRCTKDGLGDITTVGIITPNVANCGDESKMKVGESCNDVKVNSLKTKLKNGFTHKPNSFPINISDPDENPCMNYSDFIPGTSDRRQCDEGKNASICLIDENIRCSFEHGRVASYSFYPIDLPECDDDDESQTECQEKKKDYKVTKDGDSRSVLLTYTPLAYSDESKNPCNDYHIKSMPK